MAEVGILIVDNDVVSQRALKNVLDAEGWCVRIVPTASHALPELASGTWNLAIVNIKLIDLKGPIFAIMRDIVQADVERGFEESAAAESTEYEATNAATTLRAETSLTSGSTSSGREETSATTTLRKRFRVLFLVPATEAAATEPTLEREGLPYSLKPYHLHEFLEKVSELLVECGAIERSMRGIGEFSATRTRRRARSARDARRGTMFASREDYQMTEEEFAEWERQEEEERKKREKESKERGYRY